MNTLYLNVNFISVLDYVDRHLNVCNRHERGRAGRGVLLHDIKSSR